MRAKYIHYGSPQFRILSDEQIEELHFATLQILERTGVLFESQEALELLDGAGANVSDPGRVKIPSYLVEQALKTAPKMVTLYTREGEPAIVLNGMTGAHFGSIIGLRGYLDPYTRQPRETYVEDIADYTRVIDASPNIEWHYASSTHPTVPADIAEKVTLLQVILNSSKPVACTIQSISGLREMIEVCSVVAGGEKELRAKPFLLGSSEPVTPLVQGKDAIEGSLLCAEKGIPFFVYTMPMAGATTPATFPAVLAIANAEALSHLVVTQLKKPGAPIIVGTMPSFMDMRTTIFPFGAPELSFLSAAFKELSHYYRLPMFGTAGCTDSSVIDAQAGAEITYQILMSALSGADLVHDIGMMSVCRVTSPELAFFENEIIDMVKVSMGGIEINDETLPLDLIERVGPRGTYISEKHTLKHFRKAWVPKVFDRSMIKSEGVKTCEKLLNEMTIKIIETHQPKPLPEDVTKELKKVEENWLKQAGLKEYPSIK